MSKELEWGGQDGQVNKIDVQTTFLTGARVAKVPVTVFLVNGFQLRGVITNSDNFTVEVQSDGKQQVIYKHTISTIIAAKPVRMNQTAQ